MTSSGDGDTKTGSESGPIKCRRKATDRASGCLSRLELSLADTKSAKCTRTGTSTSTMLTAAAIISHLLLVIGGAGG